MGNPGPRKNSVPLIFESGELVMSLCEEYKKRATLAKGCAIRLGERLGVESIPNQREWARHRRGAVIHLLEREF